jgi:hypothetical protein
MKQWQRSHPELFNRRVTNQPGHDITRGITQILYQIAVSAKVLLGL